MLAEGSGMGVGRGGGVMDERGGEDEAGERREGE